MNGGVKKKLKIILPIVAVVVVGVIIALMCIFLTSKITAEDYFNSLNKSSYTRWAQTTTIKESDVVVYQKSETLIYEGDNIYHKIEEKQLSEDLSTDYVVVTNEYYYTQDKMYYLENNEWKIKDFDVSSRFNYYNLKVKYFNTIKFDEKIKSQGTLEGKIKGDYTGDVVNTQSNLSEMYLTIIVNKDFKAQSFKITAKTASNRDLTIENIYTYEDELVFLPSLNS